MDAHVRETLWFSLVAHLESKPLLPPTRPRPIRIPNYVKKHTVLAAVWRHGAIAEKPPPNPT